MSQLFDYFACERAMIEQWTDALATQDEEAMHKIEDQMHRVVHLRNVGQDEFNLLAACVVGSEFDIAVAAADVDLVTAIEEEEGPWIMAFSPEKIRAIAGATIDQTLLQCWAAAVAELHGSDEKEVGESLTLEVARSLQDLCRNAVDTGHGVFICFYG